MSRNNNHAQQIERFSVNWSNNVDARDNFRWVKDALNNYLGNASPPLIYLTSPAAIALRAVPPVPANPTLPDAIVNAMTAPVKADYRAKVKQYKDDKYAFDKAAITLSNDYTKGATIIRELFTRDCIATSRLADIAATNVATPQACFKQSLAYFYTYEPNHC